MPKLKGAGVKTTIWMDRGLLEDLKALSDDLGLSKSEVIRQLVEEAVKEWRELQ